MSFYDLSATRGNIQTTLSVPHIVNVIDIDGISYPPDVTGGVILNNEIALGTGVTFPTGAPLKTSNISVTNDTVTTTIKPTDYTNLSIESGNPSLIAQLTVATNVVGVQGNGIFLQNFVGGSGISVTDFAHNAALQLGASGIIAQAPLFSIRDQPDQVRVENTGNTLAIKTGGVYGNIGEVLTRTGNVGNHCLWQPLPKVALRIGVDPSSNVDPWVGGLIVNSASTQPLPAIFNIPLTTVSNPGLQIGDNVNNDPNSAFTVGANTITCNITNDYVISMQFDFLSTLVTPNNICIVQVLVNGNSVFTSPPAISSSSSFVDLTGTPIVGPTPFNLAALTSGSAVTHLNSGDVIAAVLWVLYDSVTIALTSNISISSI